VRVDAGPNNREARRLYCGEGYRPIPPYSEMPAGSFWGEKHLGEERTPGR
jgi:hypothetical protein